jgi:hypothetical protein
MKPLARLQRRLNGDYGLTQRNSEMQTDDFLMPKDVLAMLLIQENELYAALNFQTDERRGSE